MPSFRCVACFKRFVFEAGATRAQIKEKENEHRAECENVCRLCNKGYVDVVRGACTRCGRDKAGNTVDVC